MNYLLDCGAHFFQGLKKLNDIYHFDDNWIVYSFESNPITFELSKKQMPNIGCQLFHSNQAVSISNGTITVNCDFSDGIGCGQGSNILSTPPNKDIEYHHDFVFKQQDIECIDLCDFIHKLKNTENLIVKMDIEGEEFNILPKIINTNTYRKINTLYIEFHERFFIDNVMHYRNLKDEYVKQIESIGCNVIIWE